MSGAQFNIGQQQAGVINNVGGDLNVGRIEGTLQVGNQLVADLRAALDRTPMPGPTRMEAGRASWTRWNASWSAPSPTSRGSPPAWRA
jgi:hypothetical protein